MIKTFLLRRGERHGLVEVSDSGYVVGAEHPYDHLFGRIWVNAEAWAREAGISVEQVGPDPNLDVKSAPRE